MDKLCQQVNAGPSSRTKETLSSWGRKCSLYSLFLQTCLEEYKMKYPDSLVNTDEFSRKCSERCKISSAKEKVNLDDMANCYDREKNYVPLRGDKHRKKKELSVSLKLQSILFPFCSKNHPKTKTEHSGLLEEGHKDLPHHRSVQWRDWKKIDWDVVWIVSQRKSASGAEDNWTKEVWREYFVYHAKGESTAGKEGLVGQQAQRRRMDQ